MKARKTALPAYTLAQERANWISHLVGAILAVIGTPFIIIKSLELGNVLATVSVSIFMLSMMVLYFGSTFYHAMPSGDLKRVLRVLDHNNVFILIAGTYTPYCLIGLLSHSLVWTILIYAFVIILGTLGVVLNSINLEKFRIFSMIAYLATGWIIVISFYPLTKAIGFFNGTFFLLLGGISYSIGALLYCLGKRKSQWLHFVFHIFCLIGTFMMYLSIYFYVV